MSARYAVYFVPPAGSLLHTLGASWLARDARGGDVAAFARPAWLSAERHAEAVRTAAGYGFHATLKAPITLRPGTDESQFLAAVANLAKRQAPCAAGALEVSRIGGFLALTIKARIAAVEALADACVEELDRFRAEEADEEKARRRAAGLTARQEDHLVRFGYPYVREDFFFHMTLTKALNAPEIDRMESLLSAHFRRALAMPLPIGEISVCRQSARGSPFTAIADFPLGTGETP